MIFDPTIGHVHQQDNASLFIVATANHVPCDNDKYGLHLLLYGNVRGSTETRCLRKYDITKYAHYINFSMFS